MPPDTAHRLPIAIRVQGRYLRLSYCRGDGWQGHHPLFKTTEQPEASSYPGCLRIHPAVSPTCPASRIHENSIFRIHASVLIIFKDCEKHHWTKRWIRGWTVRTGHWSQTGWSKSVPDLRRKTGISIRNLFDQTGERSWYELEPPDFSKHIMLIPFQKSDLKRHGTTAPKLCFSTVENNFSAVENRKSLTMAYKIVKEQLIAIQNSVRLTAKFPAPESNPL